MATKNPYAAKNGGPKPGQGFAFFAWEAEQAEKRREKLTPEQRQQEEDNRRAVQRRWDAEASL
ncbi:hypothetical protein ACO2Q8_07835 [Larkinella sp. VNQ87]|uniref:hypothetical protein n=1 Tax=Larkinella sp. VNQ87 TaxID=3400921 RepID=UPI003BFBFECA